MLIQQVFQSSFVTLILFKGCDGVFEKTKFHLFKINLFGDFELRYDVVLFMGLKKYHYFRQMNQKNSILFWENKQIFNPSSQRGNLATLN